MSAPEFDGQPMTKREVLIARRAVDEALSRAWPWIRRSEVRDWIGSDNIRDELYPLPKVTRPRVVQDPCRYSVQKWRVGEHGCFECLVPDSGRGWMRGLQFRDYADVTPLPERVKMWADLLANPTEEVDA